MSLPTPITSHTAVAHPMPTALSESLNATIVSPSSSSSSPSSSSSTTREESKMQSEAESKPKSKTVRPKQTAKSSRLNALVASGQLPPSSSTPSSSSLQLDDPAMIHLLGNQIEYLEGKLSSDQHHTDVKEENQLTKEEVEMVQQRRQHLLAQFQNDQTTEAAAAMSNSDLPSVFPSSSSSSSSSSAPSSSSSSSLSSSSAPSSSSASSSSSSSRFEALLDLYISEYQLRLISQRQYIKEKERSARLAKQKEALETLCKELQRRNKLATEEIRHVSITQQQAHLALKEKFETSLNEIQKQLNAHTAERVAANEENQKLKESLTQLLKLEKIREEHNTHQIKTKEIEYKLLEAKLAQQQDFAAAEARKAKQSTDRLAECMQNEITLRKQFSELKDNALATESALRTQLSSYADKFDQVQQTLAKSNELFVSFKAEMEKMSASVKKLEKEKAVLEKKNNQSQLTIIQMFEERNQNNALIEKLTRQKNKLQQLSKELLEKQQAGKQQTTMTQGTGGGEMSGTEGTQQSEGNSSGKEESSGVVTSSSDSPSPSAAATDSDPAKAPQPAATTSQ